MTGLTWERVPDRLPESYFAVSGSARIGEIAAQDGAWRWRLGLPGMDAGGVVDSRGGAKDALAGAFASWLDRAGLVPQGRQKAA